MVVCTHYITQFDWFNRNILTCLISPRWAGIKFDLTINNSDGSPFTVHSGTNTAAFLWSSDTVTFLIVGISYFWSVLWTRTLFSSDRIFSRITVFLSYKTLLLWNNLWCPPNREFLLRSCKGLTMFSLHFHLIGCISFVSYSFIYYTNPLQYS